MKLGPVVAHREKDSMTHQGTIGYIQRKPGRVEFLQEDHRSFDYYIQEIQKGQWQVLVDCNKSNDSKVLEDLINKNTRREIRMVVLDQDSLSSKQTIRFFDELATRGMSSEWRFTEVKQLVFRKAKQDVEEEVEESQLSGITQAILEGNDLRENPFVKQSEESGYRFTAMTYEYENKTKPFVIQVHAEFKGRPKVFEVSLKSYKAREGIKELLEPFSISMDEDRRIRSDFWSIAKEIYDELGGKQP